MKIPLLVLSPHSDIICSMLHIKEVHVFMAGCSYDQLDTGHLIKWISNRMRAGADKHFSDLDLTFQQVRVLHCISRGSGQVSQKQIEDHLNVSHPTVTGLVARLEKSGYVTSSRDSEDRRNKLVSLTEKARSAMAEMEEGRLEKQKQLVKGLSDAEIAEANRLLGIMLNNLKND